MTYDNRVSEIAPFPDEVLGEVVREGEALLAAQLSVAAAADQRAMTFAGLLLAATTAATGGVVALMLSDKPDWTVGAIGACYALAAIVAAGCAIWSAKPGAFSFPGNEPASWHPEQWHTGANGPHTIQQARVEQAINLQSQTGKNKAILKRNARWMRAAVITGFAATVMAAVAIAFWGLHQWSQAKPARPEVTKASPATAPACSCCVYELDNSTHVVKSKFLQQRRDQRVKATERVRSATQLISPKRAERTAPSPAELKCRPSRQATGE